VIKKGSQRISPSLAGGCSRIWLSISFAVAGLMALGPTAGRRLAGHSLRQAAPVFRVEAPAGRRWCAVGFQQPAPGVGALPLVEVFHPGAAAACRPRLASRQSIPRKAGEGSTLSCTRGSWQNWFAGVASKRRSANPHLAEGVANRPRSDQESLCFRTAQHCQGIASSKYGTAKALLNKAITRKLGASHEAVEQAQTLCVSIAKATPWSFDHQHPACRGELQRRRAEPLRGAADRPESAVKTRVLVAYRSQGHSGAPGAHRSEAGVGAAPTKAAGSEAHTQPDRPVRPCMMGGMERRSNHNSKQGRPGPGDAAS